MKNYDIILTKRGMLEMNVLAGHSSPVRWGYISNELIVSVWYLVK